MIKPTPSLLKRNLITLLVASLFFFQLAAQNKDLANYNVRWDTQSSNSAASMPCGGGDIGLNVWVEGGDVLFYLSRSGTFDENNAMLKLGRVRIKLSPNPFAGMDFKQELLLKEGGIKISGSNAQINLWVDVFRPVVHIEVNTSKPVSVRASYESWRMDDHLVTGTEFRANSYKRNQSFKVTTYKDEVSFNNNAVLFYHRNRNDIEDIFDYTVRMEGMTSVKSEMYNPIKNNTFGGLLKGDGMIVAGIDSGKYADADFKSWSIKTKHPVRLQEVEIGLQVDQSNTLKDWQDSLASVMNDALKHRKTALVKTREWWRQFWERSYIYIDGPDSFVSRNYQLFRYQLGCNAYGKWPTKFNGGLFTFDPAYVDKSYNYSPDFRLWGGGTMTAQNQRLVYYPLIKSGDFDMLKSQFDFYLRSLHNAELRSKVYWNHGGACFTEQIENFGLPNVTEYEPKRPAGYDAGMEYNAWLEYLWETVFEFCQMMLDTERYEGRDIKAYTPFIESCLTFYDEHYQQLARKMGSKTFDEKGHFVFYPSSSAETFKMAYNSTTLVSALTSILTRMLELPAAYLDTSHARKWTVMLQRIPPIPVQVIDGHKTLAPAVSWSRIQNSETPQLYPVYPWGIYGIGKPDLDLALNTWNYDPHAIKFRSYTGWRQYNIFAARLGLTKEAADFTRLKFQDSQHRFPTFWGPGFDWTPDHNWGGSAMIGLQEMLMQVDGKKIFLLPAWPREWNASFKLHAPYQTVVEAVIKNGKIIEMKVTPSSRAADVIVMN